MLLNVEYVGGEKALKTTANFVKYQGISEVGNGSIQIHGITSTCSKER